jgi:hypothetical protein
MGAYARAQNILTDDADHLTLVSNKKSDNSTVSSFAYMVNTPANGRGRGPGRGKVECPLFPV